MKTKKILVLSGLKQNLESTIKSAASLAKLINANVDFLYVKKPTEIVDNESQLTAIRSINREQIEMQSKMKRLLEPYTQKYDIRIKSKFAYGNVKNEIKDYLNLTNPDIVIIGKKNVSPFKFKNDGVTDFILNTFEGPVLIAPKSSNLDPEKELSIGILNDHNNNNKLSVIEELGSRSANPLKSFTIINESNRNYTLDLVNKINHTEFVFEKNDNVLSSVSNYIDKSKVNLLCLDRSNNSKIAKAQLLSSKEIISKINVPLLFGGKSGFGLS